MTPPRFILTIVYLASFSSCLCFSQKSGFAQDSRPLFSAKVHSFAGISYSYYVEQRLKEDLFSLIRLGHEIAKDMQFSNSHGDYKQLSQRANKIHKLAARVKSALTFGNQFQKDRNPKELAEDSPSPEVLQREVEEIGNLVHKINRNYLRRGKHVINAKVQTELYETVDTLESLAWHVKQSADGLSQAN